MMSSPVIPLAAYHKLRLATAVGLLVLGACAPAAGTREPESSPSVPPSTAPGPPSAGPTSSVAPLASASSDVGLRTLRFDAVLSSKEFVLNTVVHRNDRFVAGGCRWRTGQPIFAVCGEALILTSPDGRAWTEAAIDHAADSLVIEVADTPHGMLARGLSLVNEAGAQASGVLWRSDDGTNWQRIEAPELGGLLLSQILVLGNQVLLFGGDQQYDIPTDSELRATTDFQTWTVRHDAPPTLKVVVSAGLAAVGPECEACEPGAPIFIHRSFDGVVWSLAEPIAAFGSVQTFQLTALAGRAVAIGVTEDAAGGHISAVVDNPAGWVKTDLSNSTKYVPRAVIERDGGLFLIATNDVDQQRGWTSSDASHWQEVSLDGADGGFLGAAASSRDATVALLGSGDEQRLLLAAP